MFPYGCSGLVPRGWSWHVPCSSTRLFALNLSHVVAMQPGHLHAPVTRSTHSAFQPVLRAAWEPVCTSHQTNHAAFTRCCVQSGACMHLSPDSPHSKHIVQCHALLQRGLRHHLLLGTTTSPACLLVAMPLHGPRHTGCTWTCCVCCTTLLVAQPLFVSTCSQTNQLALPLHVLYSGPY